MSHGEHSNSIFKMSTAGLAGLVLGFATFIVKDAMPRSEVHELVSDRVDSLQQVLERDITHMKGDIGRILTLLEREK